MSDGELNAARALLPQGVRLINRRAQALSLDTSSVDYVLSHMALVLMDDIEQVIQEIRRVFCEGGVFSAVVGRAFLTGEVGNVFLDIYEPIAKTNLAYLPLGDARTRSEAGWRELLQHGFDDVVFEDIDVAWTSTPEQLWLDMLETYDADRMSDATRAPFKSQLFSARALATRRWNVENWMGPAFYTGECWLKAKNHHPTRFRWQSTMSFRKVIQAY